ncbi:MAG: hypothetical protein AAGJ96_00740 [Pseudomonadota bacterium]
MSDVTVESLTEAMARKPGTPAMFDRAWLDGLGIDPAALAAASGRTLKTGVEVTGPEGEARSNRPLYILEPADQEA